MKPAQVLAAAGARRCKKISCGPGEQVINGKAKCRGEPVLRPARINVLDGRGRGFGKKFFELADGCDFAEAHLIEVRLIAVLESAHQLDTIEGSHLQVGVE